MENMNHKSIYYLEKAPVAKAIMHMVIPMLLSLIASVIYNITDAFFIGKLDNTAMMAAVTLALPFSSILMALGHLFGVGAGTYVSRLLGEGNSDSAKNVCSINFWSSFITGIIFMLICLPVLSLLLQLLGANGDTLMYTADYIKIFIFGAPFVIANFSLEETVRAEGGSTASMIGMIAGVLTNMVLDPIFIFLFHMDVAGAALASVIGNAISVGWFHYYLQKKSNVQSVSIKDFKPSREIYSNIIKVGISAFLLDGFLVITCLLFNKYSVLYGNSFVAGFGISQRVVQIVDFIGMSFSMGVVPLIAFAFSSKSQKRLMELIKTTVLYMFGITLGLSGVLLIFRTDIIGIFSIDPEVIALGQIILFTQLCSTIFAGLSALFTGIFQAFGTGMQSTVMSVIRGIVFIPILIFGNLLYSVNGVIWAMTISEGLACMTGLILWLGLKKRTKNAYVTVSWTKTLL